MARSDALPKYLSGIEENLFSEEKGKILIGGEEVPDQLLQSLRDEAEYLLRSRLWEILVVSARNESVKMLLQSTNMEHVQFGKALSHWTNFISKVIIRLGKK